LVAAKQCLLGLWAASEEVVWRRVLLGELLFAGAAAALCGSTLAFALAHRRRGLHLGTGAAFGGLYLASGILASSIAAHWTYNALVGARLERARSS
jgi:membrane protease YdiL (CAAX protease family)